MSEGDAHAYACRLASMDCRDMDISSLTAAVPYDACDISTADLERKAMKTAIITGASRGVGRAVAETLAHDGWRLIINCRSRFDLLEQEAEKLRAMTVVHTVHGPITDEILATQLGAPDDVILLVNNAGISTFNLAQDVSEEELSEMLDANVKDMFHLTQSVIPYLLRASEGRILNMSSVWGVVGASMESVYSLTKGAVNAFTEALGKELAPNHIPVNAIAIGCVDTDMNGWMSAEDRAQVEDEIPYGRMCTPEEVAEFVRLLSIAPKYLTGQILRFDGGWI